MLPSVSGMSESGGTPPQATGLQPLPGEMSAAGRSGEDPAWPATDPLGQALSEFWRARRLPAHDRTLVVSAGVGLAGGALLVGHQPGLGVAVVGLLMWAAAVPALIARRAISDLLTAGLCVALVGVVAIRDADWVIALSLAVAAGVGAVAATSARSAPASLLSLGSWVVGVVRAVPWIGRGVGARAGRRRDQVVAGLRSVVVTVVLLLAFGLLFTGADRVFASYLARFDLGLLPAQLVVGLLTAVAAATLAHLALAPPPWADLTMRASLPARRAEWLLPVLALDALVMIFVLVQVGALVGGHRHVLETAGLTYAQYARQGFAQLVLATALTLLVMAVAVRRAPRLTRRDLVISRAALGVLCLGALGVVASALRRLDLYVDAFGLTRTRLLVIVIELAFAAVLLLVAAAGIRWRGRWLPRAIVQVAAVAALGLAVINPDAQILRYNTTTDLDVPVDIGYLQGLSADAVPAMATVREPLRSCLIATQTHVGRQTVAGWNLGRSRAATTLSDTVTVTAAPATATC